MNTTIVGHYEDFATASRVAGELMIAGIAQAEISVVGREEIDDGARFAFAGALAASLSGALESDFERRLVAGLAALCVPPRGAARHAAALAHGGGLVAIHADPERARRAESVMQHHGATERYAAGTVPLGRAHRGHAYLPEVPRRYTCPA
jgi:hypothetical protein